MRALPEEQRPCEGVGRPELILLIGLQAAGKTSFFRERFAASHVHVSKDLLRNNRRPERRQRELIAHALAEGRSVVVDNTNPRVADRAPLIAIGHEYGARILGYYFPAQAPECAQRNRAREGRARVPDVAVFVTAKRLQPPSPAEGFHELHAVSLSCESGFTVIPFSPADLEAQ